LTDLTAVQTVNTEFNTAGHVDGRHGTTLDEGMWDTYQAALKQDAEGKRHVQERLAQIKAEEAARAAASGTGAGASTTTRSSKDTVIDTTAPSTSGPTTRRTSAPRPSFTAGTGTGTAGTASTLGSRPVETDTDSEPLNLDQFPDFDGM